MKAKCILLLAFLSLLHLQAAVREQVWRYQLLEGSFLTDECLICGRPTIPIQMRGSFMLRLIEEGPFGTQYAIENADFQAGPDYKFKGSGIYEISGAVALLQSMTLSGDLQTPGGSQTAHFENESGNFLRPMPMIAIALKQTNGTVASTTTLDIVAAPLREIWLSTTSGFTMAIRGPIDNQISSGDLLSSTGRVVKRNHEFQEHFPGPNMSLDAVDILPGAEIAFSTETMGVLSDGDFANARTGAIVHWQDFMGPLANDPGLDALQFESPTRFYFSVKRDIIADEETVPNLTILNGDILLADRDTGEIQVFKKHDELMARFHPDGAKDYGLDALYIWASGEIWFSTVAGFSDSQLGPIGPGDLLSDTGNIVYRNLELVELFRPVEDASSFGLDAVTIISDAAATPEGAKIEATHDRTANAVILTWKGVGRVFQVERARDIVGPWEAISPILPELRYKDFDAIDSQLRGFYRLRQW